MANPFDKIIDVVEHITENFGVFNAGFTKDTAKQWLADAREELGKLFRTDVEVVKSDAEAAIDHHNDANTPPADESPVIPNE